MQPPTVPTAPTKATVGSQAVAERTPFQQSVAKVVAEREAQGLPVPANVTYQFAASPVGQRIMSQQGSPRPGDEVTIVATTVMQFDDPSQAGNARWPDLVVDGEVPANAHGYIHPGNYSKVVREYLARQDPDIWSNYEFGLEPRTYTFVEEYRITYPADAGDQTSKTSSTNTGDLLMGFSIPGDSLDYSIHWGYDVIGFPVIDFLAGFKLAWGLGIRLPMEASMTTTNPMLEGSTYWPVSSLRGLDWSAADFAAAGVPAENGNEFFMRFQFLCGVFLEVATVDVINLGVNVDLDRSSSFTTPLGPGEVFSLPSIDQTIWDLPVGVAYGQIGFRLTPQVGSDRFTTDWAATGQDPGKASGAGNSVYTIANGNVPLGPVTALDGPGNATIGLTAPRYYFTNFLLDLSLFFYLNVFGVWDGTFEVPITDFDLGALTGNLYAGPHAGTPGSFSTTVAIQNVAPTAQIDRTGASMFSGVPAFIVHAGDPLLVRGRSMDPGLDDLTLSWDWGDGDPAPDVSTTYPVPHDVTDQRTHVFGDACLYNVAFRSVDDDQDFGLDTVPVVVTGADGALARSEGYWQHQCRGNGHTDYDQETIGCFLEVIDFMSAVFGEARSIASPSEAFDVLFLGNNGGSAAEQLDRELLVAWLNFACGAFDIDEPLDTDGDEVADATFADVIHHAEMVRLDPSATESDLRLQAQIVHHMQQMALDLLKRAQVVSGP